VYEKKFDYNKKKCRKRCNAKGVKATGLPYNFKLRTNAKGCTYCKCKKIKN